MLRNAWDKSDTKSISKRMLDKVRPDESLQKRITAAQREFDVQIMKLDGIHGKLQKHHDSIFQKVMLAQRSNMVSHARAYAQELAQVRKMLNMVGTAKLSLEQVKIRLDTVTEFGDVVVTLSPCMSLLRGLAPSLSGIMPQANSSMNDISQMLGDVISGSSMNGMDTGVEIGGSSEEALEILDEANKVLVGEAQSAFPDVPASLAEGGASMAGGGAAAQPSAHVPPHMQPPIQMQQQAPPQHSHVQADAQPAAAAAAVATTKTTAAPQAQPARLRQQQHLAEARQAAET